MPSVPVPPITLLTDMVFSVVLLRVFSVALLRTMVARCRLLAAHGPRSCLSVRTQPLTATGAPSQTSTMPCHAIAYHMVEVRKTKGASYKCNSKGYKCNCT